MKLLIVVAVVATCLAAVVTAHPSQHAPGHPRHHSSESDESGESVSNPAALQEFKGDLRDFVNLWPRQAIKRVLQAHLSQNVELLEALVFVRSETGESVLKALGSLPEIRAIIAYLRQADWPWNRPPAPVSRIGGRNRKN